MANRSYFEFFIYPHPKSYQDIWGKLETSIDMAISDTTIDDVIITGDFNDNQNSCTKMSSLLTNLVLHKRLTNRHISLRTHHH